MPLHVLRPSRRRERGQTMVLGALTFLVLALLVALSFNLGHALRKKVSLQQHSDVLAYSMAVLEARALNYYAVSNRSIAASYVAMNSIHAYMAASSVTGEMMRASRGNFQLIAAQEFAQCGCKKCFKHCVHAFKALRIASKYGSAGRKYDRKVRGLEGNFNTIMTGLDRMVDDIHASQSQVHTRTLEAVRDGRAHGLGRLADANAPGVGELPGQVGRLNADELECAVDGRPCESSVASSPLKARARVMTEVANASRPGWPANRGVFFSYPSYLHGDFLKELRDIPGEGSHWVLPKHKGTAKTVQSPGALHGPGQSAGNEGLAVSADESGAMFNQWKHGIAPSGSYSVRVWSDKNGGGHRPGGAHQGRHRFEGVNTKGLTACARGGNCFMKFRANDDARRDWGQPRVYSYLSRKLRWGDSGKPLPWELNDSATVTFRQGASTGKLTLAADEGAALSQALVYYHRFGENGWREAPNLFSPYWRAKLHPLTREQAVKVLEAAGDEDAARLVQGAGRLAL
ncbi:MAG TPA: hypothetical protein VFZ09_24230 [Archangium sp.]|uniref:hypothetical protein n=1 Tax=Archangium sp. TaxID=1872627 RepID=UPI002E33D1D3|nr:hypothetical protein [Archangium sp.]HEX5749358.1 hypothetical protein [Archangium sp.]